jgi:hypothetical protein
MTKKGISDEQYEKYLHDYLSLNCETRWDYLKYYNERDVKVMIKPISFLIEFWASRQINMLKYMTLASCAQAVKFWFLYNDLDLTEDYHFVDLTLHKFKLTLPWFLTVCNNYKRQDLFKNRDVSKNVGSEEDYIKIHYMFERQNHRCLHMSTSIH